MRYEGDVDKLSCVWFGHTLYDGDNVEERLQFNLSFRVRILEWWMRKEKMKMKGVKKKKEKKKGKKEERWGGREQN